MPPFLFGAALRPKRYYRTGYRKDNVPGSGNARDLKRIHVLTKIDPVYRFPARQVGNHNRACTYRRGENLAF